MSSPLEVVSLGLILSVDSFSAAIAMGGRRFTTKNLLTFAVASASAEALSTAAGYFAGAQLIASIAAYDHWIAFGLLAAVAMHMLYEGISELRSGQPPHDPAAFHGAFKIMVVSFATSLDAFGVGIGLGIALKPLAPFAVSIAAWAFVATIVGMYLGKRASRKLGPLFSVLAAGVLSYFAVQMLKI